MKTKLYGERMIGTYGEFELDITVGATNLPDLESDEIQIAAHKAAALVKAAVMSAIVKATPLAQEHAKTERRDLIALFPEPVFVEEIPNGYCRDWCCCHLPWFIVTTTIGRFKIGWRKRVIHLEWTDTTAKKDAVDLFPEENVTKEGRIIHAWSLEDAKRYVETIFNS